MNKDTSHFYNLTLIGISIAIIVLSLYLTIPTLKAPSSEVDEIPESIITPPNDPLPEIGMNFVSSLAWYDTEQAAPIVLMSDIEDDGLNKTLIYNVDQVVLGEEQHASILLYANDKGIIDHEFRLSNKEQNITLLSPQPQEIVSTKTLFKGFSEQEEVLLSVKSRDGQRTVLQKKLDVMNGTFSGVLVWPRSLMGDVQVEIISGNDRLVLPLVITVKEL